MDKHWYPLQRAGPDRRAIHSGPRRIAALAVGLVAAALIIGLALAQGGLVVSPAAAPPAEVQGQSYSVAAGGASELLGLHPASILGIGNIVLIECDELGLVCTGVDGKPDDVASFSFGGDFSDSGLPAQQFSVAAGSLGAPGTAVAAETACNPTQAQADVFQTPLDGTNSQDLDGDGTACAANAGFGLGLDESQSGDDVDGLDRDPCQYVDLDCDGHLDGRVYFSLAPGSPSLAVFSADAADILASDGTGSPVLWADGQADLGLAAGDAIDALCLLESGDTVYGDDDELLFSLAPGSPSLASLGAQPGDLLRPGLGRRVTPASKLGLAGADDVDALQCEQLLAVAGEGDIYLPELHR